MRPTFYFHLRYGTNVASSRERILPLINHLRDRGFSVHVNIILNEVWPKRFFNLLLKYIRRAFILISSSKSAVHIVQYDFFPGLPFFVERFFVPSIYFIDIDDAMHQSRNHISKLPWCSSRSKFKRLASTAQYVAVGSKMLESLYRGFGASTFFYPSTPTHNRRELRKETTSSNEVVLTLNRQSPLRVVWVGTPTSSKYLFGLLARIPPGMMTNMIFNVIGAGAVHFKNRNVHYYEWTLDLDDRLDDFGDIGVMPLDKDGWSTFKCAYKIKKYFQAGLPVIASPIGENNLCVKHGVNGFLAGTYIEWLFHLTRIKSNPSLLDAMARNAKNTYKNELRLTYGRTSEFCDLIASE